MNAPTVAIFAIFLLGGLATVAYGVASIARFVRMQRRSSTPAGEVGSGLVEVEGEVVAGERTLSAPFSGEPCVAYEFEVERDGAGQNPRWGTVSSGSRYVPFRVRDETGTVGVEPTRGSLSLDDSYRAVYDGEESVPPERIRAFVDEDREADHERAPWEADVFDVDVDAKNRYTERRLDPGDVAFVAGVADVTTAVAGDAPSIVDGDDGPFAGLRGSPFVVADAGETAARRRTLFRGVLWAVFGLAFAAIPAAFLYLFATA